MQPHQDGELSDAELWRRVRADDGFAFGQLFERHADAVFRHCKVLRVFVDRDAGDATSIVFLEAWRRRHSFHVDGHTALPLFLALANNVLRNFDRTARRYQRLMASLPATEQAPDPSDVVEERDDRAGTAVAVRHALQQLGQRDREVLGLCMFAELSYDEAAAVLEVPVGTVKSRLSRAKDRFRSQLTKAVSLPDERKV